MQLIMAEVVVSGVEDAAAPMAKAVLFQIPEVVHPAAAAVTSLAEVAGAAVVEALMEAVVEVVVVALEAAEEAGEAQVAEADEAVVADADNR
jgi:hypothetical protein